jgi:hypothetical protein
MTTVGLIPQKLSVESAFVSERVDDWQVFGCASEGSFFSSATLAAAKTFATTQKLQTAGNKIAC